MKRIQSACLEQTLCFRAKDDSMPREEALATARSELAHYKARLERSRVRYKIDAEEERPDGSILLTIRKQYLTHDCGGYLA